MDLGSVHNDAHEALLCLHLPKALSCHFEALLGPLFAFWLPRQLRDFRGYTSFSAPPDLSFARCCSLQILHCPPSCRCIHLFSILVPVPSCRQFHYHHHRSGISAIIPNTEERRKRPFDHRTTLSFDLTRKPLHVVPEFGRFNISSSPHYARASYQHSLCASLFRSYLRRDTLGPLHA